MMVSIRQEKETIRRQHPLFNKAIKADAQFAQAYYMLGFTQRKLSQNVEAMTSYKKAIEIDKQFENAYVALGNLQMST